MNRIVQEGLKDIHESIAKVRNAVRYTKSFPKRVEKFLEAVKDANIQSKSLFSMDVPTKWNSTYLMLEAVEKFERAFDKIVIDDDQCMDHFEEPYGNGKKPKGPSRSLDWENARLFCKFLRLFYKSTLRFFGLLIVISNSYFHELVGIQNELYKLFSLDGDSLLKRMAESMKIKNMRNIGEIWRR